MGLYVVSRHARGLGPELLTEPRWRRRISLLAAVLATVGLVSLGSVSAGAGEVDQIAGHGDTASALTVSWQKGLLSSDNDTVATKRDPASPFAFMQPEFSDLVVHVSQTEGLVHQAITVSWSGGKPTETGFKSNFLQLMQCYGDESTGPDPEGCEYGSDGMLPSGIINPGIGTREGNLCETSVPSTTAPPRTKDGSNAVNGCDPSEPSSSTGFVTWVLM